MIELHRYCYLLSLKQKYLGRNSITVYICLQGELSYNVVIFKSSPSQEKMGIALFAHL